MTKPAWTTHWKDKKEYEKEIFQTLMITTYQTTSSPKGVFGLMVPSNSRLFLRIEVQLVVNASPKMSTYLIIHGSAPSTSGNIVAMG